MKIASGFFILPMIILILACFYSCSDSPSEFVPGEISDTEEVEEPIIELNLRVHIMTDIIMTHSTGIEMASWVTPDDVNEIIIPEMNSIWGQAKVKWIVESIIEEDVVKGDNYEQSIAFIASTKRDSEGHSDPARLPHLYALMQPQYRSTANQLNQNLFHIYLFPFIGNTSQGNAMSGFDYHCVVGTWSNKHNGGGVPEKTLLVESHSQFVRGSLSRTISHELGHVLGLGHDGCTGACLMSSNGYAMTQAQISKARFTASNIALGSN